MRANPFRSLADIDSGIARYVLRAWLIAFVPSLALLVASVALGRATLAPKRPLDPSFVAYSIAGAPAIETALMLAVAWLLARAFPQRPLPQIVWLAILSALAHLPGGGWTQTVDVFWPLLVYSAVLVAWRPRSGALAFLVTAAVHALYNASFLALGAAVAPRG